MAKLHYEFKLMAFVREKKGVITRLPSFGFLDLKIVAAKGGADGVFYSGTDNQDAGIENPLRLGAEMQDILQYKNVGMVREADKYSNDFNAAHVKRKKLLVLLSFRASKKNRGIYSPISSALLVADRARISEFKPMNNDGDRVEVIKLKFKKPKISYSDPTIFAETVMKMIKIGKGAVTSTLNGLGRSE